MVLRSSDPLQYYTSFGDATDPGDYLPWLEGLPSNVADLCAVVQGLLVHVLEAWRYDLPLSLERQREVSIGSVAGILARIHELDARPLTVARPPEKRVVATCHDFSVLLCAMLRQQGRPARPRAGFAAYLLPGKYIDHWLCEYWQPEEQRWIAADAQLDEVQRLGYGVGFDPCDVPETDYLTGARAWERCRDGQADAQLFGFSRWWGIGYVRHVLLRDLLALNKKEGLPWESAGLPELEEGKVSEQDRQALDRISQLALAGNGSFFELRSVYEHVIRSGRPPDWRPWRLEDVT